jgi:hydroxyacylglutathione hydrolase
MISSLGKLAALPDDTQCIARMSTRCPTCASRAWSNRTMWPAGARKGGDGQARARLPTVPSTIGLEKATNPFLRYREPAIAEQLVKAGRLDRIDTPLATFTALRLWKNDF